MKSISRRLLFFGFYENEILWNRVERGADNDLNFIFGAYYTNILSI